MDDDGRTGRDAPGGTPPGRGAPAEEAWRERFPPVGYWLRVGALVIGLVVTLQLLVELQAVLLVVVASAVLAIGLQPAIRWLERRGVTSGLAMGAIMVAGLVVAVVLALLTIPMILSQIGEIAQAIPEFVDEIEYGSGFIAQLEDQFGLLERLSALQDELPGGMVAVVRGVGTAIFQLVLVLTLTPYFALAVPDAKRWIVRLAEPGQREDLLYVLNRSTDLMANYIAGNLFISLIAGVVAFVGLVLIGVPYATTLAVFVAVTDVIPAVGATLGALAVVGVAAMEGPGEAVAAGLLILVYQQVENYVIGPRVMNEAIDVRPATGIVALLAGGALAGPIGALLALPIAAMVKIVLEEYVLRHRIEKVQAADAEAQAQGGRRHGRGDRRRGLTRRPLP
jgi:predicted PurR-regulated permease PerM